MFFSGVVIRSIPRLQVGEGPLQRHPHTSMAYAVRSIKNMPWCATYTPREKCLYGCHEFVPPSVARALEFLRILALEVVQALYSRAISLY